MSKIVLANLNNALWRYEKSQGEWLDHLAEYHNISIEQIDQFVDTHKQCFKIAATVSMLFDYSVIDLSKFDLVIVVNQELIREKLPIHLELLKKQFHNNNIIVVTSEYLPTCLPDKFVYRYPFFLTETAMLNEYQDTFNNNKLKRFDALLGLNKEHRQFIFNSLSEHGLLDKCYISLISNNQDMQYIYYSPDLQLAETNEAIEAIDKNNGVFYSYTTTSFQQYYPISRQIPLGIYKNTWFSIVAESNHDTWTFISEKTAKPLFAKRLFVMFAAPYHLKRLREWGFQTFDTIIDESYDLELNNQLRYKKAFDQVLLLSQADPIAIYEKITPILEHNHALISNREYFVNPLRDWLTNHIINPS